MRTRPVERGCPSLLDRLLDDAPDQRQDRPAVAMMSNAQLRDAVLRDLHWLFNTTRAGGDAPGPVADSVLGFGLPALAGRPASSWEPERLARALADAIVRFEPRVIGSTVRVRPETPVDTAHNLLRFRIEAQLRAQPLPLALLLRTEIDLESGQSCLREAA